MSDSQKSDPIGWMLLDDADVIVGATMGADPGFLCPIPADCRLRVFHQPVQIGAKFVEGADR